MNGNDLVMGSYSGFGLCFCVLAIWSVEISNCSFSIITFSFLFFFTVTTQKFVPAAAPDPKSTVICYAYFTVTSNDSSDNKVGVVGEGREGRMFL